MARFCGRIIDAVESDASPQLEQEPLSRRLGRWWSSMTGDLSPLRRRHRSKVRRAARNRWRAEREARVAG